MLKPKLACRRPLYACSCPSLSSAGAPLALRASQRPASTTTPTRRATLRTQRTFTRLCRARMQASSYCPWSIGRTMQPERGVEHRVRRQRGVYGRDLRVPDRLLRLRPVVRTYVCRRNAPAGPTQPISPTPIPYARNSGRVHRQRRVRLLLRRDRGRPGGRQRDHDDVRLWPRRLRHAAVRLERAQQPVRRLGRAHQLLPTYAHALHRSAAHVT